MTPKIKETYYYRGQLESKIKYKNDNLHGLCTWWYSSGHPQSKVSYINGNLHGVCTWWYPSGQLEFKVIYNNGKLILDLMDNPLGDEVLLELKLIYGFQL